MSIEENNAVTVKMIEDVAVITIDYPPVNALSQPVRIGLMDAIASQENNGRVKVMIIRCAQRTFIAGADIKEFGKPPTEPFLPDVVNRIESSTKPVIASLFGTSLGGGLEVALACHYRVALNSSKVGLPEVNLGLIPGAGGTQRLPKIIGVEKALEMTTSGKHFSAKQLKDSGLFDKLVNGTDTQILDEETMAFARQLIADNQLDTHSLKTRCQVDEDFDWENAEKNIRKKARGQQSPLVAFNVIKNTVHLPTLEGMAYEREQFLTCRSSVESAALRHVFAAEKQASKFESDATPLDIKTVGIIGGGTMGSGIATNFLLSGFHVTLIEQNQEGLNAGVERISNNFSRNVKSGRMTDAAMTECMQRLTSSIDKKSLAQCDLIIEAVFENIDVKKELFRELDTICQPTTLFATNTSYLDIDAIAAATQRPANVIGMHFFSPAHIMKLLEVVKAEKSSDQAIATALQVGKKLGKMAVMVGVCFGFAGNRMYTRYGREVQQMLLEGARIEQVDNAMTQWGMAMGPLAVQDLSGIDIGHNARSAQPFPEHDPGYFRAAATMVEAGRLGRKTGQGFYRYDDSMSPIIDETAQNLIKQKAESLSIPQKLFTDEEIVERAILALISEGLSLLKENIVQRMSDIDVIWLHGYGFPRFKGGPMFQAQQMGNALLQQKLSALREQFGEAIWPDIHLDQ